MVYRKGELSNREIDRRYPFQVALRASATYGDSYVTARLFCEDLSLSPRGQFFRRYDEDFNVWCFAELEHAERFRAKFGGEIIAPKDRPRWPGR